MVRTCTVNKLTRLQKDSTLSLQTGRAVSISRGRAINQIAYGQTRNKEIQPTHVHVHVHVHMKSDYYI